MTIQQFTNTFNQWGQQRVPFLFVVDFEIQKPLIFKLDAIPSDILFEINGFTNSTHLKNDTQEVISPLTTYPDSLAEYKKKFDRVYDRLCYGDSYLTNLTVKTEVKSRYTLRELFFLSKARYKLLYKNEFLVFSPETFVQIKEGMIYSFPMKGTIDASIPDAKKKILEDKKEMAEHVTIVDLIRNDLSQVASAVSVPRFRYVDELKTNTKILLQVSSEIRGKLPDVYINQLGTILLSLLPAGSVSGSPKAKTLEIIKQTEQELRGYYTGVFGYFDGLNIDSGVMIRYIEKHNDKFFYRSGGGITTQSIVESEYQEMIDKIYVPVN
jgi:para-aminobenzoate synthetase component I